MPKNKSPGNDGPTKELYEIFGDKLIIKFIASLRKSFLKDELIISQKDKSKTLIQSWRTLSSLNADAKIVSKVIAERLNKFLLFLISLKEFVYVDGTSASEGGRIISDLLEINNTLR